MGASSGIGHAVAKKLISEGWKVGLAARRTEPLERLREQHPQHVHVRAIDVNDKESVPLLRQLIDDMGGITLYFHAAGIGKQNPAFTADIEEKTVDTNVVGFTRLIGTVFRYMTQNEIVGHIAVISSIAGTKGLGPAPAYSATKAFQSTYIEALEQLAANLKYDITFTDIRPGFVDTPLLADGKYPMLMKPEKVAESIIDALKQKQQIRIIDTRYQILTAIWRCIPRVLWKHIKLVKTNKKRITKQPLRVEGHE